MLEYFDYLLIPNASIHLFVAPLIEYLTLYWAKFCLHFVLKELQSALILTDQGFVYHFE